MLTGVNSPSPIVPYQRQTLTLAGSRTTARAHDQRCRVNLPIGTGQSGVTAVALSIAGEFSAHLTGITISYEPIIPGTAFGTVDASIIGAWRTQNRSAANTATEALDKTAQSAGVSAETRVIEVEASGAGTLFAQLARRFDISVIGQPDPEAPLKDEQQSLVEAALFDAGRPLLIVPYIQRERLKLGHGMVCWNGSRVAARAVGDALPLLARTRTVEVLIVSDEHGHSNDTDGSDLAQHLSRHGIPAKAHRVPSIEGDVADAILSYAADWTADYLVMGGYGHSRLREFVLGSTTRAMLKSMTVPVLMSH